MDFLHDRLQDPGPYFLVEKMKMLFTGLGRSVLGKLTVPSVLRAILKTLGTVFLSTDFPAVE